jgi:hypothetical protein
MSKKYTGGYSSRNQKSSMPVQDGKVTRHKPRRNYWGNLYEDDTYKEETHYTPNYDYSDYDENDDHDSYYDNSNYE